MVASADDKFLQWRALLVLGRVSNLPTVWSNCLAGWLLAGGESVWRLLMLSLGATFFYIGGMYLNDAFDVEFDRQYRRERPIPSGQVSERMVWTLGFCQILLGTFLFVGPASVPWLLTLALATSIVVYNVIHKWITFSPIVMAACRFFLFLAAAATGTEGYPGQAIWTAFALAAYIVGLSFVARRESVGGFLSFWPCVPLAAPLILAFLVNNGDFRAQGVLLSLLLLGWSVWCLKSIYWTSEIRIGATVSGLLAGIVLVDLLAVAGSSIWLAFLFALLFGLAVFLQKFVPAT